MRIGVLLLTFPLWGLWGCSGKGAVVPDELRTLSIKVDLAENANCGGSVRMLVRRVRPARFAGDSYEKMNELARNPDDTLLADQLLRARSSVHMRLPLAKTDAVGVYFLLKHAEGEDWRALIPVEWEDVTVEVHPTKVWAYARKGDPERVQVRPLGLTEPCPDPPEDSEPQEEPEPKAL